MPSYVITGVSRGIGYEFLRQYSIDPKNIVIGVVRDKPTTDAKIAEDADLKGRTNIHILKADLGDYNALRDVAAASAKITGGGVDYLIANGGIVPQYDLYDGIGTLAEKPEEVTEIMRELFDINVTANIHLFKLFIPLLLKGQAKKVIALSTGLADPDFTNKYDVTPGSLYAISKAALNMVVTKYSTQYKQDGILFLSLAPGMVDVGHYKNATPEQLQGLGGMMQKFAAYKPDFSGPVTPEQAVTVLRGVIANVSIEKGHGGDFISQNGNKEWL